MILVPTQTVMLRGLTASYKITDKVLGQELIDTALKVGMTTLAGKALIKALKAVPGLNVATSVLNAVVAGGVTFALGEGTATVLERAYKGEELTDLEKMLTDAVNQYLPGIMKTVADYVKENKDAGFKQIIENLLSVLLPREE